MYRNQWLCGALPDQFFADGVNNGVSDTDFVESDDNDYIMIGNSEKKWPKSTNMALGIDCEALDEDGRNGIILAVIANNMTALEIALADETQNVRPPCDSLAAACLGCLGQAKCAASEPGTEAVHTRGCRLACARGAGQKSIRHWLRVSGSSLTRESRARRSIRSTGPTLAPTR